MIMKRSVFKYWGGLAALLALFGFIGCSDEPDEMNYYTFKGQMMSDYLLKTEQFSDFATLVNRAGMMDMLSSYGSYTCFAPTNAALQDYIKGKGLRSLDDLTDADCDTIVRTHLVENMYSTSEMNDGDDQHEPPLFRDRAWQ